LLVVSLAIACASEDPPTEKQPRCNSHAELCDRRLDQVALAGAHNAMSNADEGWDLPNHNFGIQRQLDDGIRAFLLDTYSYDDAKRPDVKAWLCHGYCQLGRRPLAEVFTLFDTFLEAHPREVIIVLFEDHLPSATAAALFEQTGLIDHVFTGDPADGWPTLGQMIDSGGRLLITAESQGSPPSWHHRFWDLGWDTPYSFQSLQSLQVDSGSKDSCRHNRGTTDGSLFLLNHWVGNALGLPDPEAAKTANGIVFLEARARRCQEKWQHIPNIVAVDFHDIGDVLAVVDALNGVGQP